MRMKKKIISSKIFLWIMIFFWLLSQEGRSQVITHEVEKKVIIENRWIKINYDLTSGKLSASDKIKGKECLSDCYSEIEGIYGTLSTTNFLKKRPALEFLLSFWHDVA
jgi:hypothetical protein